MARLAELEADGRGPVMALPFAGRTLLVDKAGDGLALLEPEAAALWRTGSGAAGRAFRRRIGRELARGRSTARAAPPAAVPTPTGRSACRVSCRLGEAAFEIGCGDAGLAPMVLALLAPLGAAPAPASHRLVLVRCGQRLVVAAGEEAIAATDDPDEALGLLIDALVDRAWPRGRWMAVAHAGAVADGRGALLLPGASGAGKSTLVAGLVADGWQFLGDDVAPLDALLGAVAPVPLALSAREAVWPLVGRLLPGARVVAELDFEEGRRRFLDLRPPVPPQPVPLRALLFPCLVSSGPSGLDRLEPGRALAALVEGRCWLSRERPLVQRLLELLETVPAVRARYRTLEEGVALARAL